MKLVRRYGKWLVFLLVGPLLLVVVEPIPFLVQSNLMFLTFSALAATGLTMIMGFAGQISLGHAAFYGVGAYALAILTTKLGWPPLLALLAGLLVAGVLAALLAGLVFRIQGHFLAMATLAFGLIFFYAIKSAEGLTGGNNGIGGIPTLSIGPWEVEGNREMFLLAWVVLTLGLLVARNIVDSRTGRALRALGSSEVAAGCCGINVARAKIAVFVVGALYASVAGSLYALYITYISPTAFGVLVSVQFLVISTVGGLGSVWGAPIGAAFLVVLTELSRGIVPIFVEGATGDYQIIVYGVVLLIVLLAFNQGIAGFITRLEGQRLAAVFRRTFGKRLQTGSETSEGKEVR